MSDNIYLLAISVATQRISCAYFINDTPYDTLVSEAASQSVITAHAFANKWLDYYNPTMVVLERLAHSRKGSYTRELNTALGQTAHDQQVDVVYVARVQRYANKYAEAEALAQRFPDLKPYVPKPRQPWEAEPRNIGLFAAVALGVKVIQTAT